MVLIQVCFFFNSLFFFSISLFLSLSYSIYYILIYILPSLTLSFCILARPSQQLLSPFSTRLLKQLKIPYGTDRGLQGVDVDPSLSVTQHIFECLALLKEVNRIYKAKGSLLSRSVGERVMLGFTNELGKIFNLYHLH